MAWEECVREVSVSSPLVIPWLALELQQPA